MATMNARAFCDRTAGTYGWDPAKVGRLTQFLMGQGAYVAEIDCGRFNTIMTEFIAQESQHKSPPGTPLTDTS